MHQLLLASLQKTDTLTSRPPRRQTHGWRLGSQRTLSVRKRIDLTVSTHLVLPVSWNPRPVDAKRARDAARSPSTTLRCSVRISSADSRFRR